MERHIQCTERLSFQHKILLPAKQSFTNNREMKTFSYLYMGEDLVKKIIQAEMKGQY